MADLGPGTYAARKISGISRASGLPRPYFQNADPGRHAPCQSRAATTSPSQLSTSPPAFSVTAVAAPNVRNDGGEDSFTPSPEAARRRMTTPEGVKESPSDTGATSKEKNNIVIPEFSAWLTLVLEQCRAENIRNLPRQRAPTPLFPERRPREACSMPISDCHDLPLATFNLPSRVFRHGCRRAEYPERRWGGFFHTLSRGQALAPATALSPNGNNNTPSSFRTSFRVSGMKMSGISAARRGVPPELRLRCREATAREKRRGNLFLSSDTLCFSPFGCGLALFFLRLFPVKFFHALNELVVFCAFVHRVRQRANQRPAQQPYPRGWAHCQRGVSSLLLTSTPVFAAVCAAAFSLSLASSSMASASHFADATSQSAVTASPPGEVHDFAS